MRPALPLTGGCACGAQRYRATALPLTLYACHCTHCQLQSGSAFGLSMTVRRADFVHEGDELGMFERQSASGRLVRGRFCRHCGARLFNEPARAVDTLNVKPGTLDDTSWIRTVAHFWLASAQPWFAPPPDALAFEQQPEDREPLNVRFRELMEEATGERP